VHEAAREAIERARAGDGPSAIEVDTCRFYGHHSGDAQLYRGKDEVKRLREQRDCIRNFRARVIDAALLETDALDAVAAEVATLIDRAVETAREAPLPPDSALLKRQSWRMRLAFFPADSKSEEPDYELGMRLLDNGVSRDMSLDYADYVIRARLDDIEPLPRPSC